MIETIFAVVGLGVGIAVGMVLGIAYRKRVTEAKIGLAEDRAKKIVEEAEKVAEGLAMMAKMSDGMLEKLGVTRFGAAGETFDAEWHNAVMHEENEAFGENEISEVFQVGYRKGDKVIRYAMVKVAN